MVDLLYASDNTQTLAIDGLKAPANVRAAGDEQEFMFKADGRMTLHNSRTKRTESNKK